MTDAFLSPNQKHKTTRVDRILLIVRDHGMNSLRSGMVPERARSAPGRPGQSVAGPRYWPRGTQPRPKIRRWLQETTSRNPPTGFIRARPVTNVVPLGTITADCAETWWPSLPTMMDSSIHRGVRSRLTHDGGVKSHASAGQTSDWPAA
jgi:hypothetical protein